MICPLLKDSNNTPRECFMSNCAWWNERLKVCSVFVIGDQVEDIAIQVTKEVGT
jgi:hypothetical protein